MSSDRKPLKTAPMAGIEPVSADLPFVRPNPLLYPPAKRNPTPPSFAGLPFVPASNRVVNRVANDRASIEAPARAGGMVSCFTDGPFELAAPVAWVRAPRRHMTIIAKLSCDLVDGGPAGVREEAEPLDGDAFEGDEPDAPLLFAGDFAPVKEACDVLVYAEPLDDPRRPMRLELRGRGGSFERRVKTARELGPLSPYDAGRVALLGTYDMEWFEKRWPNYADDLDVRYFQAAPGPQRLASATGDESYAIDGIDGERPSIAGQLPGVRPVALVHFVDGRRGLVSLRLDTIGFFPGEGRADLVWRCMIEVTDDDAPEILDVFVTMAHVDEVLAEDEIEQRSVAFQRVRADADDDAEPAAEPDGETEAIADEETSEGQADFDDPANDEMPEDLPAGKSPDEIAAMMRAAGADAEDVADMLAALTPEADSAPIPSVSRDTVRAEVVRRLEANESLEGLELFGADLSELDFSGRDFSGFDLTGAIFAGANLGEATLDEVELSGAVLTHANLMGASAKAASFQGADLTGARLRGADLEEADFSEAVLDGAVFDEANLAQARLYDVRAERTSFQGAVLRGARAEGARADRSDFSEALLDGSVWEASSLEGAKLDGASLVDVSLVRARCTGASFARADLTDARLVRATLIDARMVRANLFEANLDRADMARADLRASSLHGASVLGTNLQGALLEGAITSYSRVGGRRQ